MGLLRWTLTAFVAYVVALLVAIALGEVVLHAPVLGAALLPLVFFLAVFGDARRLGQGDAQRWGLAVALVPIAGLALYFMARAAWQAGQSWDDLVQRAWFRSQWVGSSPRADPREWEDE
ncbi:MAG TPA: hypothetical protein VIN09_04145 [Chloroflexota bacterium]